MSKSKTALWGGAVMLAVAACDQNRDASSAPPAPAPEPELLHPAGGVPVTTTGASMEVDPLSGVENRDQVKEDADEVKIVPGRETRLIAGFGAAVRSSPGGEAFAAVEAEESATEVARNQQGDYYLVTYADPTNGSRRLAGWVYKDALENTGWATSGSMTNMMSKLGCTAGESHLRADRDFCGRVCKDDGACDGKRGESCDGLAFYVHEGTSKLTDVRYCVAAAGGARGSGAR